MAYQSNLDVNYTDPEQLAIKTDLSSSVTGVTTKANVTISAAERETLNGIDNTRLPYALRAVTEFGAAYPDLVSKRVTTARATNLFGTVIFIREMQGLLDEYKDRVKDLSDNCEELVYQYMTDMYANAKRYRNDVAGADVVADYLGELFEGQGVQNPPEPVTP